MLNEFVMNGTPVAMYWASGCAFSIERQISRGARKKLDPLAARSKFRGNQA